MIENVYELVRELNRFDQYFPEGMKDISFWHYTSADGLKGILTADGIRFWFTRSDCLNDESEGSGIFGVYEKIRNDWCDAHPEQADFADVQCSIDIPQERNMLAKGLLAHNLKEFGNLNKVLPKVYAEEKDNWI